MIRTLLATATILVAVALSGCGPKEITNADDAAMRKQYGREAYEKAMKDAGRQKELDEQKRQESEQPRER